MRLGTSNRSVLDLEQDCRGSEGLVPGDLCSGRRISVDKIRD